jgi:iron complex transport system substrate-binding protein
MLRRLSAALCAVILGLLATAATAQSKRVVSANLCTDQLLLALADRSQIASLSPFATDRALSYMAAQADGLPLNRGTGEDVVRLGADLVLLGPYDSGATRGLIARQGLAMLVMGPWTGLADGREQIRTLAQRLGHPARGEALVGRIDAALAAITGIVPAGRSALVLHRRLFVSGQKSLTTEVLTAAGFADATVPLGLQRGGFVTLERLLKAKPDYLVVSPADESTQDQGSALLVHDALKRMYPPERRLVVPDRLTICGGPATVELIETLGREIRAKVRE